MAKVLEYSEYRHFLPVIDKAKEACSNSNNSPLNHFEDVLEMIKIGREVFGIIQSESAV